MVCRHTVWASLFTSAMIISEYYCAYLVSLRLGHQDVSAAFTLEGEGPENIVYVEILSHVAHGGDLNGVYQSAFVWAAQFDHFLIMRALLDGGHVDAEEADSKGRTALSEAIQANSRSALITLLAHGIGLEERCFVEADGKPRTMQMLLRELWLRSSSE